MPFVIHKFGTTLRGISSSSGENVGKYFFHLLVDGNKVIVIFWERNLVVVSGI